MKPTISDYQIASRIAKTIDTNKEHTQDNFLIAVPFLQKFKQLNELIIHYTHENRLQTYKEDIQRLWNQTLTET
jgi:hypothetical protein